MCLTGYSGRLATACWLVAIATQAAGQIETASHEGLVLSWEVQRSPGPAATRQLADHSGSENHGLLLGEVIDETGPSRLEFDGKGAVVAERPIRPERLTLEAIFRVDRTRGPLQLIVTTHPPKVRKATKAVPGNSRQWFLQIRGEPPQQDGYLGSLEFGIFGEDGQWHSLMSQTRIAKGWHHAIGIFDGKRVRLILDGEEQTRTRPGRSGSYEGRINKPPDALINLPAIGSNSLKNSNGFKGAVALARLYDRALNDNEIGRNFAFAKTIVPDLATQTARTKPAKPPFRVLYSNDFTNTGIVTPWHKKGEPFFPDHLRASVREAEGVSVHMLQPAHGAVPWWPSKLYRLGEHHAWWAKNFGIEPDKLRYPAVHQYILDGGDPFKDFISECRRVGQTPFVSMRLNDTHHLHHAETPGNGRGIHSISRFYVEHPEWWLGAVGSGLDWSVQEVFELDMAPTEHQSTDGLFRLMTAEDISDRQWMAKINGTTLEPIDYVHKPLAHPYESGIGEPAMYVCFRCPRRLVRDGINKIALILEDGRPATVRYWDLVLP